MPLGIVPNNHLGFAAAFFLGIFSGISPGAPIRIFMDICSFRNCTRHISGISLRIVPRCFFSKNWPKNPKELPNSTDIGNSSKNSSRSFSKYYQEIPLEAVPGISLKMSPENTTETALECFLGIAPGVP